MSSTSQYTTFTDLYTGLQELARVTTGVTATENIAKRLIDAAHHALYIERGDKLYWAKEQATLTTHPQYTTGTLTATEGSGTITGASTEWNTSDGIHNNMRIGGKIRISGRYETYEITAVASDTSATISPVWAGDTASSLTYVYFEDEYALASDFTKPVDTRSFDSGCRIRLVGDSDFRMYAPRNSSPSSYPKIAHVVNKPFASNATPVRKIQFAPPPADRQVIPYTYVTGNIVVQNDGTRAASFSATTDQPIMPIRFREVIVLGALERWLRDRKDDAQRALLVRQQYEQMVQLMIGDQDRGHQRPSIRVDRRGRRSRAIRPWRSGVDRFDIDGSFDRLEDW